MNNTLVQSFGACGTVANIIGIQFEKKKHILIGLFLTNLFFALSFFFLESYSGAMVCLISTIQILINYILDKKNKKYPIWLIVIYFITTITFAIFTCEILYDIMPVICSILLILMLIQKNEKNIRFLTLISVMVWATYDFLVGAWTVVITDGILAISTIFAVVRFDVLKKIKEENDGR